MLSMFNTTKEIKNEEHDIAVLPVGALEQHGSHLPVGTDNLIASAFAERVAKELNAYLLPCINIASSIEHRKSAGTVYLKADTLAMVIRDIAESLMYSGYKKIVIINGHGGNWILKPTIRQINLESENFQAVLLDMQVASHRFHEVVDRLENNIHACEKETSIMLYLYSEYVKEIVPTNNNEIVPQAYMDYFDTSNLTEDGYWGNPELGTAEKGKKLLEIMVECALEYMNQLDAYKQKVAEKKSESVIK